MARPALLLPPPPPLCRHQGGWISCGWAQCLQFLSLPSGSEAGLSQRGAEGGGKGEGRQGRQGRERESTFFPLLLLLPALLHPPSSSSSSSLLLCLLPAEGSAMAEVPTVVRIKVALKIQPNDGPVYFKVDGQRFGQNRTIKLLTGAKYKVEVAIKPGTVQATTMGIGGVTIPLEQTSKEAQLVTYTGIYDTEGVTHTKSGERQPIQVNIQVTDIGAFETVWQVKFYDYHKRDHCQWGNSFGCIEYECKPNETRSLMWINKETFF